MMVAIVNGFRPIKLCFLHRLHYNMYLQTMLQSGLLQVVYFPRVYV